MLDKDVLRQAAAAESSNEIPIESLLLSVAGKETGPPSDHSPESGVYTEGGLVFVPDVNAKQHKGAKLNTADLLNNMMGFTRHERLDVKKPGPAVSFKPQDAETDTYELRGKPTHFIIEPNHIFTGNIPLEMFIPKMKKVFHPVIDHGPHSVDTDYAYVKFKSP